MKQTFRITRYLPYIIILCVVFLSMISLFQNGFLPTHDGEYHLIRFYEFGRMLAAGHLFPRWAPGLNSGYGVPLFTFFYPLPNYIGSFFRLFGFSLADAFRLTLGVGYLLAAVTSYLWLRRYVHESAALAGALIGAFVPYWFVDIFVRGSVGEVLAIGFAFGAFAAIAWGRSAFAALSVSGLILSHNIMAMIFLPILLVYTLITSPRMIGWIALGVGISAYFWLPAIVEQQYVVGLNAASFMDHFPEFAQLLIPSWGSGFSGPSFALDEMSYQIGVIPIVVLFISTISLLLGRLPTERHLAWFFLLVWLGSIIFMLPVSTPLWKALPFMANIQYPWRLLSVGIPLVSFLSAFLFVRINRPWIAFVAVAIALLMVLPYAKPVLYAPRSDDYYLSRREFTDGTSSLGNSFSTRWMTWQPERPAKRMEIISGEGLVTMKDEGVTTFFGEIVASSGGILRTHVAYFPGWRLVLDGKSETTAPDEKGMMSTAFGPGPHRITVYFSETPLRWAADLVSLICLVGLIAWSILSLGRSKDSKQ